GRSRKRIRHELEISELETRILLSAAPDDRSAKLATATIIPLGSSGKAPTQAGHLASDGDSAIYQVEPDTAGLLFARVHPDGLTTELALLDSAGRVLVQSDAVSARNPDDQIELHLEAGIYFLEVTSEGGAGDYSLFTSLTPTFAPFQRFGDPMSYNNNVAAG